MAVWFDLHLNAAPLGAVEIRRLRPLDLTDPEAIADEVSAYEVRRDDVLVGYVEHRYGDRAWKLLALAAELLAETDARELDGAPR